MIGLDTNIVVRYLAQDDRVQRAIVNDLFERRLSPEQPGFTSIVAMVETAWVLQRTYKVRGAARAGAIERRLHAYPAARVH